MDEVYDRKSSHGDFHFKSGDGGKKANRGQRNKAQIGQGSNSVQVEEHGKITVEQDIFKTTLR